MEILDQTQWQWLLLGIGGLLVVLLYFWLLHGRIKEGIRKRRRRPLPNRRPLGNEPILDEGSATNPDYFSEIHDFGDFGRITPSHHLADKVLVDVEISPVIRREQILDATLPPIVPTTAETMRDPHDEPITLQASGNLRREPELAPEPTMTIALTVLAARGQSFNGPAIQTAVADLGFQLSGSVGLFEYDIAGGAAPLISMAHLRNPGLFETATLEQLDTPGVLLFTNLPGRTDEIEALEQLVVLADQLTQKLGGMIGDEQCNRLTNQGLLHLRSKVTEFQRQQRIWAQSVD